MYLTCQNHGFKKNRGNTSIIHNTAFDAHFVPIIIVRYCIPTRIECTALETSSDEGKDDKRSVHP